MTTTHDPARSRNTDTARARLASRASYARRRHTVWIAELRECGVTIVIPPDYSGLPIDRPSDEVIHTWAAELRRCGMTVLDPLNPPDVPGEVPPDDTIET
jgi:hypothetical protein